MFLLLFLVVIFLLSLGLFLRDKTYRLVTNPRVCRPSNTPGLWYENIPNLSFRSERHGVTWNNNAAGQRGAAISYQDADAVILFVGDSLIWGVGAEDSGTLPALTAENLPSSSVGINLGVGSYSLWDYAIVLRDETFEEYHPQTVVLGLSTNDWIDDVTRVKNAWTAYVEQKFSVLGVVPWDQRHVDVSMEELTAIFSSETAALSWREVYPHLSVRDFSLAQNTFDDERWKKALDPLNQIIRSCRENHCRLIVIVFPQKEEFLPGFEALRPQKVLIDHLRDQAIPVILGHDVLRADSNPLRFYPFENDGMHINQEGYNVYAQALQPYLNR